MRIETITLKNFKAFKDVEMKNIPPFCVVVGANGAGKSTLFGVFAFLRNCMIYNVSQALEALGGIEEVRSRGVTDAPIVITLQFRMDIADKSRLVTYHLEIDDLQGRAFVKREFLRYRRDSKGLPYHFLDFERGKGYAIKNEADFSKPDKDLEKEEQVLEADNILAIKGLGQFERFKAASAFRRLIENWHVSDFHISAARGSKEPTGYAEHLSATGDNLQRVAYKIQKDYPELFQKIVEKMKRRVPGIASVKASPQRDKNILLEFVDGAFQDEKDSFIDNYVSDGTLKMFAYLVLLHDPKPHPILCVEEPENQLYPTLLGELAEEFAAYANQGGQVFVSTHSPDLLNAVGLESVYWLEKNSGYTAIHRAADNPQLAAFMKEGDKMGYLWQQGFFNQGNRGA